MIRSFVIFIILVLSFQAIAQLDVSQAGDCNKAIRINTKQKVGPTTPPNGPGKKLEISGNPKTSIYFFEEEHNTVWYQFMAIQDGNLIFDIIPENVEDDYDFLLFQYNGQDFCKKIKDQEIKPVRTNIARNDPKIDSKTGLNMTAEIEFKDSGPGESYSKYITVKKGQIFYLVVDNVYDNGGGHQIVFDYLDEKGRTVRSYKIKGSITGDDNPAQITANIVIKDKKSGEIIVNIMTDNNGNYSFDISRDLDFNREYNLSVVAEKYFFHDITFVPKTYQGFYAALGQVKLQKLKQGKNYKINNIYFYPASPMYIPESENVLKNLLDLMNKNEKLEIQIEGHIHGCRGSEDQRKILSEARARSVKDYLVNNGIDENRISTIGYGCQKMIYPDAQTDEQKQENRRVEIKVLKY